MADRRMFAKTIIDSDDFLDMPMSAQALYFHLSMRADDDGFINNPKKIQRSVGASVDDLKLLIAKQYILTFDSGVIVIRHWKIHNYIQKDRYKPTIYEEEKAQLELKSDRNKEYIFKNSCSDTERIQTVSNTDTQVRLGKVRLGKDRLGKDRLGKDRLGKDRLDEYIGEDETPAHASKKPEKHIHGEYKHVRLTDEELKKLESEFGAIETQEAITYLDEYIEMKGAKYKSHYLALRKWVFDAVKETKQRKERNQNSGSTKSQKLAQDLEDDYQMLAKWANT